MLTKKHFLDQIKKLQVFFDEELTVERVRLYYETLSPDFEDADFDKAVNVVLKNSFKFPPIAAFYKKELEAVIDNTIMETGEIADKRRKVLHEMENKLKTVAEA